MSKKSKIAKLEAEVQKLTMDIYTLIDRDKNFIDSMETELKYRMKKELTTIITFGEPIIKDGFLSEIKKSINANPELNESNIEAVGNILNLKKNIPR